MNYSLEQYHDQETNRKRWAVLHLKTCTWYFPNRYGKKAAEQLKTRLEASEQYRI